MTGSAHTSLITRWAVTPATQLFLAAAFVLIYFGWLGWSTLLSASTNARLVSVFETDEFDHIMALRTALEHQTLALNWSIYGQFFFNLALVPLSALNAVQPVTDRVIIVALRLVSLGAAASGVFLTFALASRYWGYAVAWFAMVGLAVFPSSFNYWAITSHPDTLQVACTVFALYAVCRFAEEGQERWLEASAAGAGLAFAAKYGGILLLPCLFVLGALVRLDPSREADNDMRRTISRIRAAVLLTGLVGLAVSLTLRETYTGVRRIPVQDIQLTACVLLVAVASFGRLWKSLARSWHVSHPMYRALGVSSIFWIAFVLASPFSLNRLTFASGMLFDAKIVGFGQFFAATGSGFDWFAILASPRSLGAVSFGLACVALYRFIVRVLRERKRAVISPDGVLWMWIAVVTTLLVLRVHLREDRYLLVILPALLIAAGDALLRILDSLSHRLKSRLPFALSAYIAIAWVAFELSLGASRQITLVRERQSREQRSETVLAGVWLQSNVPSTARVLYDWYSYIPPAFHDARGSWGMNEAELAAFGPDVIVVNDVIRKRFASISDASRFYDEAAFLARYRFYESLEKGRRDFGLVESVGPIRVYRRHGDAHP